MSVSFIKEVVNIDCDYRIALFSLVGTTYDLKPSTALGGRSIGRRHPGNLSLTCPKLILHGVKHGIGFKDTEVAQVCLLAAGPSAPLSCVTSTLGEHAKFLTG